MDETETESDREAPSPEELRGLMESLGLGGADLAAMLGFDRTTPHAWLHSKAPIPIWVPVHLCILLEVRELSRAAFGGAGEIQPRDLPARLRHLSSAVLDRSAGEWNKNGVSGIIRQPNELARMEDDTLSAMTSSEFQAALTEIGWKQSDFVRHVGCGKATASRWATGEKPIPAWVPAHLDLLRQIRRLQRFLEPRRARKARGSPDE